MNTLSIRLSVIFRVFSFQSWRIGVLNRWKSRNDFKELFLSYVYFQISALPRRANDNCPNERSELRYYFFFSMSPKNCFVFLICPIEIGCPCLWVRAEYEIVQSMSKSTKKLNFAIYLEENFRFVCWFVQENFWSILH